MARRRKRSRKGFQAIPFDVQFALGTLGSDVVLKLALVTMGEDFFWLSVDCFWSIQSLTAAQGPIGVGIAHGDLTATEIGEALDAELADPDDIITRERARRPVRRAGMFRVNLNNEPEVLNDGKVIRTRAKFSVGDGHALVAWARNQGGSALSTTSPVIELQGTIYGRWQR